MYSVPAEAFHAPCMVAFQYFLGSPVYVEAVIEPDR